MSSQPTNIPSVDLNRWMNGSPADRTQLAAELRIICHEIGFFYLVNHGVSEAFLDQHMERLRAFFGLPEEHKQTLDKAHSPQFRGWEALGSELTNNQVDYREQIDIGPERPPLENPEPYYMRLVGYNQWPDVALLPGFQEIATEYLEKMTVVARQLLALMSVSLGLPESVIEDRFGSEPESHIKLVRYPPTGEHGYGVGAHKDSGYLTLLLQDDCGGLEIQTQQGEWIPATPVRGSLVINIGELLQQMTHHYYVATPHRVINAGAKVRYSSAYFYCPDLDSNLDPLPLASELIERAQNSEYHRSAGVMATRSELKKGTGGMASKNRYTCFGDKYWERWIRSYPEIARKHHPDLMAQV